MIVFEWLPLTRMETPPTGRYFVAHRGHCEVITYLNGRDPWRPGTKIGWQKDPAEFRASHYAPVPDVDAHARPAPMALADIIEAARIVVNGQGGEPLGFIEGWAAALAYIAARLDIPPPTKKITDDDIARLPYDVRCRLAMTEPPAPPKSEERKGSCMCRGCRGEGCAGWRGAPCWQASAAAAMTTSGGTTSVIATLRLEHGTHPASAHRRAARTAAAIQ